MYLWRLEFLAEFTSLTQADMKLQAEAFGWIARMPPILEDHVKIIDSSRKEAEEGLKVMI